MKHVTFGFTPLRASLLEYRCCLIIWVHWCLLPLWHSGVSNFSICSHSWDVLYCHLQLSFSWSFGSVVSFSCSMNGTLLVLRLQRCVLTTTVGTHSSCHELATGTWASRVCYDHQKENQGLSSRKETALQDIQQGSWSVWVHSATNYLVAQDCYRIQHSVHISMLYILTIDTVQTINCCFSIRLHQL